jgi:hypothetical protein
MRRISTRLFFIIFMGLLAFAGASRLTEWYATGRLEVHRTMPLGSNIVTYSSDPAGFLLEFGLDAFLVAMGSLGIIIACREIALELAGFPQSHFLSLADQPAAKWTARLIFILSVCLVLSIFFFGVLEKSLP